MIFILFITKIIRLMIIVLQHDDTFINIILLSSININIELKNILLRNINTVY